MIWRYVTITITFNIQKIRELTVDYFTCVYSTLFDVKMKKESTYLNVRQYVYMKTLIANICMLAIPMNESHTGELILHLIS